MQIITAPANYINSWLSYGAAYLAVVGLVVFSLFIMEEAFQTTMFGSWPAQDAQRWDIVLESTDLMESFMDTMETINNTCGWIQPFAFVSYRAYAKAERLYIKALRSKILAHAPHLMVGRTVSLSYIVKRQQRHERAFFSSGGGNIGVMCDEPPEGTSVALTGQLMQLGNLFFIECRDFDQALLIADLVQSYD